MRWVGQRGGCVCVVVVGKTELEDNVCVVCVFGEGGGMFCAGIQAGGARLCWSSLLGGGSACPGVLKAGGRQLRDD